MTTYDPFLTVASRAKELGAIEERERIIKALEEYMGWGDDGERTQTDVWFGSAINIINGTP